jgi:hypothetical protein
LYGGNGNDTLTGGTGIDTLAGGAGDDTYYIEINTDQVIESAGEGIDTVYFSSDAYTLLANVEKLVLTGTGSSWGGGNALNNVMTGNSGNNMLNGLDGDDVLNGAAGADTQIGGFGNDIYFVDNTGDVVTEAAGQGSDAVYSSITYTLADNVETLVMTADNTWAGGNALNNVFYGSGGANLFIGLGGSDTYNLTRGASGADAIVETDGTAGVDQLIFGAGVATNQIWFRRVNNDLEVSIIGTSDKMTVDNWYLATANHVEQFRTTDNNKLLLDSQVQNLVNAMAAFTPPAAGQTTLPSNYQSALATAIAVNWQ